MSFWDALAYAALIRALKQKIAAATPGTIIPVPLMTGVKIAGRTVVIESTLRIVK